MNTIVIVPTYNEVDGIDRFLDQVLLEAPEVDVLVVDDSSPDGTGARVLAHPAFGVRVWLLTRPVKEGLGAAYRAGFVWALERRYDVVVQMDADLSHPPARVPALVAALAGADVAVGSRYVPGGGVQGWPWTRRLISRLGNVYVSIVLGSSVHDSTAGFKAFRAEALGRIGATTSESGGYCFQIENTWRAGRAGLRIVEVPITFTDRTTGESKMTGAIVGEALLRVLVWRWRELTHTESVGEATAARGSDRDLAR